MKKIFLAVSAAAAVAGLSSVSANAQGFIFGNNVSAAKVSVNDASAGLESLPTTGSYYFEFLYSTVASPTVGSGSAATTGISGTTVGTAASNFAWGSGFVDSGVTSTNSATSAGRFGPESSLVTPNGEVVSGLKGGNYASFVLVAWSSNIGNSLASLESYINGNTTAIGTAYFGESVVGASTQVGDGSQVTTPTLTGSLTTGNPPVATGLIPGFTLGQIVATPEPTSIALGVMGGLSLLALRRKKA